MVYKGGEQAFPERIIGEMRYWNTSTAYLTSPTTTAPAHTYLNLNLHDLSVMASFIIRNLGYMFLIYFY